jgi:mannose-1-phosphate guanylyltransferase/mannose-6-phosphate isomerase
MTQTPDRDVLKLPPDEYGEQRPWGKFRRFVHNEPCTVKVISVLPGRRLSLQSHRRRSELWVFLDDGAVVEIDGDQSRPARDATVFIPCGARHRLAAAADAPGPVRVLEMGFGDFDEDDIVRYDDDHGRA